MKALLLSEYSKLDVTTEMPRPVPGSGELLIHIAACGICGSDVHGYDGSSGRRIPPLVMGHEAAGTVAEVGDGVRQFAVGDRVTFDSTVYCGDCQYCRAGEVNLCDNRQVVGVSCGDYRRHGAFAEYVAVPERIVYRLPDELSFTEAAMLEAVSVALHAVRVADLSGGETALVIGSGMIGLLTLQAARAGGCSRVFVADIDPSRLKLARDMGADEVIHGSGADLIAEVHRLDGGQRRRRSLRGCRPQRDHRVIDRQRAQGWHRGAYRQHHSRSKAAITEGGQSADPTAGDCRFIG